MHLNENGLKMALYKFGKLLSLTVLLLLLQAWAGPQPGTARNSREYSEFGKKTQMA